jgi:hypothetical protein
VVVINSYRLYRVHVRNESLLTHLEFRTALYTTLLGFSLDVKIYWIKAELGAKRAFENDLSHIHQVSKRKQGTCIWCSISVTNLAARPDSVRSRYGPCAHTDKYLAPCFFYSFSSSSVILVNGVPSWSDLLWGAPWQFLYRFRSFGGKYMVLLGALDMAVAFATFLYV